MKRACPHCDFDYNPHHHRICPKCQTDQQNNQGILEVDVAHDGETWECAKSSIQRSLKDAMDGNYKALRVIHGYGSLSGVSVIAPQAISLMRHLSDQHDGRFAKDQSNPGVSLIWLNRKNLSKPDEEKRIAVSTSKNFKPGSNWFDAALNRKH